MAIDLEIKDNHLHFDGINLFRGNANNVQLGSVGGKKTPSTLENYLQGREPAEELEEDRGLGRRPMEPVLIG